MTHSFGCLADHPFHGASFLHQPLRADQRFVIHANLNSKMRKHINFSICEWQFSHKTSKRRRCNASMRFRLQWKELHVPGTCSSPSVDKEPRRSCARTRPSLWFEACIARHRSFPPSHVHSMSPLALRLRAFPIASSTSPSLYSCTAFPTYPRASCVRPRAHAPNEGHNVDG